MFPFILFRDNYGFVTFRNKADAFTAIEQGNDDTSYPKVDLCFGGRRAFCKEKYSDLGKNKSIVIFFFVKPYLSTVCLQFLYRFSFFSLWCKILPSYG